MEPVFQFDTTSPVIDTTADILGKKLPILVKRMSRPEIDAFQKGWREHFNKRGDQSALPPEEFDARDMAARAWTQEVIEQYVGVAAGLMTNAGQPVTTGAGLVDVFYARADVLGSLLSAVYLTVHLPEDFRKNLSSPRDSGSGSETNAPARGGDKPEPIAESAAPSTTAESAAATDASASSEGAPASSGAPDAPGTVH